MPPPAEAAPTAGPVAATPAAEAATEAATPGVPAENTEPAAAPVATGADQAADTGALADDGGIAEVLVTARRREETAQSVPIAVSVLGASALEDHHIDDIDDLQNAVPTLSVSPRSEARRVGKECVSTCRSRGSPYN